MNVRLLFFGVLDRVITRGDDIDRYRNLPFSNPLSFCTHSNLPFDTLYWTPLIKTCCAVCNFVCDITTWHPFFVGPLSTTTTSTTLELPTPPLHDPSPVKTYPDHNSTPDTISTTSTSTTSISTTSKTTTLSSTTHEPLVDNHTTVETYPEHNTTLAATPTTSKSTTSSSTTKMRTSSTTVWPTISSINRSVFTSIATAEEILITGDNVSVMITSEPIEREEPNVIGTTRIITSVNTEKTSNNQSKVSDEDSKPRDSNLLTIIAPCFGVIVLGIIIFTIAYKKLKKGRSSLKSKYSSSNSMTETPPTIASARVEEVDFTDVAITELWERIKNDDNYDSKLSRPGTFHRAPLASVLNPDTSDL